jgi:hypothetical protein
VVGAAAGGAPIGVAAAGGAAVGGVALVSGAAVGVVAACATTREREIASGAFSIGGAARRQVTCRSPAASSGVAPGSSVDCCQRRQSVVKVSRPLNMRMSHAPRKTNLP